MRHSWLTKYSRAPRLAFPRHQCTQPLDSSRMKMGFYFPGLALTSRSSSWSNDTAAACGFRSRNTRAKRLFPVLVRRGHVVLVPRRIIFPGETDQRGQDGSVECRRMMRSILQFLTWLCFYPGKIPRPQRLSTYRHSTPSRSEHGTAHNQQRQQWGREYGAVV